MIEGLWMFHSKCFFLSVNIANFKYTLRNTIEKYVFTKLNFHN